MIKIGENTRCYGKKDEIEMSTKQTKPPLIQLCRIPTALEADPVNDPPPNESGKHNNAPNI